MIKDFDKQTWDKAQGQTRVLILDGHSSHYTPELLEYARDHNIMILGYPPHCTHALQGLDVVCFARMKETWKQVIIDFEALHRAKVTKADFTGLFGKAYQTAFTKETIEAAFRVTGVFPFDRSVITKKQMRPSEATSVKGVFAVKYTSPVQAIITAFRSYRPTAFETSPSHAHPPTSLATRPGTSSDTSEHSHTSPRSSPKRPYQAIDPALLTFETPSKHMRMMTAGLAGTQSGSFLVSRAKYTSSTLFPRLADHASPTQHTLPQPNWNLIRIPYNTSYKSKAQLKKHIDLLTEELRNAREVIGYRERQEEANSAMLVIQDMTLQKMNESLHAKENKKSKKNRVFTGGKGRHLTHHESILALREEQDAREEAVRQKGIRQDMRERNKVEKARLELEWSMIKEAHIASVLQWEEDCTKLISEGVLKKNLPKKPMRRAKPQPPKDPQPSTSALGGVEDEAASESSSSSGKDA
jgi:hypothetical protein